VSGFDAFLRVADAIGKQRDRAEKYYDAALDRNREGVPQARRRYWARRLVETRGDLSEANGFWREIEQQLARESAKERREREAAERAEREAQAAFEREAKRLEEEAERKRREEPTAVEYELSLDYGASIGAAKASEVDITIRFYRADREPMTMAEAWEAANTFRGTGEFPSDIDVQAVDWLGIAAKRKGRRRTTVTDDGAIAAALSDFFGIVHAVDREDFDLAPLRMGSVKEDG
jgi:hypothetical protein